MNTEEGYSIIKGCGLPQWVLSKSFGENVISDAYIIKDMLNEDFVVGGYAKPWVCTLNICVSKVTH